MTEAELVAARAGFIAAVRLYAIWRDGIQTIGIMGTPIAVENERVRAGKMDLELEWAFKSES